MRRPVARYTVFPQRDGEFRRGFDPGAPGLTHPWSGPPAGLPILVIGLGNPLMGDDGLGLAALERLGREWRVPAEVRLVDGGTWGLRLLPDIEEAGRLILIDAIEAGVPPGRLVVLERDALPRFFAHKLSPHEIGLREVLALAELRGRLPLEVVAIGVQPGAVALAPGLSPEVEAAIPPLLDAVVARLAAWGHRLRPARKPETPLASRKRMTR